MNMEILIFIATLLSVGVLFSSYHMYIKTKRRWGENT